jgi:hypothetical protein
LNPLETGAAIRDTASVAKNDCISQGTSASRGIAPTRAKNYPGGICAFKSSTALCCADVNGRASIC